MVFTNAKLMDSFQMLEVKHLKRTHLDHSPLLAKTMRDFKSHGPAPFIFRRMWSTHPDLYQLIKDNWDLVVFPPFLYWP